jgi:hypothetical protein
MSVLTRIKNNQITDSTILANTKIVPGSITGALFNSNITVTSDFLITGNLTVLGNSTVSTVASTNTFVNDPLIVLNNAFSGTNTYDLGLVFNRGSDTNQALLWDESADEFVFIATSETGTTYGNVSIGSYGNLRVGNIDIQYDAIVRNIGTTTSNVNLLNTTATGVQFAGAATALQMGAATGNTAIRNNLDVGLTVQARDINATVIGNVIPAAATFSTVYNNNLTSGRVTFAGASSVITDDGDFTYDTAENQLTIKYTKIDGTNNIISTTNSNANLYLSPNGTGAVSLSTSRLVDVSDPVDLQDAVTLGYLNTQISSAVTNIQLDDTDITLHDDGTDPGLITGNVDATQWLNADANAIAFYGVGTAGVFNIDNLNSNVSVLANQLYTEANVSINGSYNSTSWNNGALTVVGGVGIGGDVHIQGDLYVANIHNINEEILVVKEPLLYLESANTYPYNFDIGFFSQFTGGAGNIYQHTGLVRDDSDSKWKLFGNVAAEPALGQVNFAGANWETLVLGNIEVKTSDGLITDQTTINVFNATATTLNLGGAATTLTLGATTGTANLRNANIYLPNASAIFTGQASVSFANTATTTLNIGGDATGLNLGATSGTTTIRNAANIQATTTSTSAYNGALKVQGGIGSVGNVNIATGSILTVGIEIPGANIAYPERQIIAIANANVAAGINARNMSSGTGATSNFIAVANSHEYEGQLHYAVWGIAGNGFVDGDSIITAEDGYGTVEGGNLILSATKDIVITTGTAAEANIFARFSHSNSNISLPQTSISTSPTTGALVVSGGVGMGANLFVAQGAIFNNSQTSQNFTVKGVNATSLIVANSNYGAVVIGGANTTPQLGATLKINSTDSLMLPVGGTSDRPSNTGNVDVAGMMRYNSTVNNVEFYDGTDWQAAGTSFTIITNRQFAGTTAYGNVDGSNDTFTIQSNTTTASTLVSINGVVQFPVLAYEVTGNQLVFTEAPAVGDVIDVRVLTLTATVGGIASGNGYNQFVADSTGSSIWTGLSSTTQRVLVDPVGNMNLIAGTKTTYDQTATNISSSAAPVLIDTWSTSSYSTAKYVVQAKNGANKLESMEALVVAEDGNASVVTYAVVNSHGATMGTLSANVLSGNCRLYYTSSSLSNSNVKVYTTYIV